MPRRLSLASALLLVAVSVFAFSLAFPPFGVRPLAWVCLVPLFVAIRSGGLARALLCAGLWGQLMAWGIASVFPSSIATYYDRPAWVGFAVGNAIFLTMSAAYYVAFAAIDRVLMRRPSLLSPLLVAAAWVSVELARGRLFTGTPFFIGNPWGLLGYTHASGPFAQVASVFGVYGIGFPLVAVNAGLAALVGAWPDRRARGVALRGLCVASLPALGAGVFGAAVLRGAPDPDDVPGLGDVAVVQGDVAIDRRWRSDFHAKNLDVYLALTRAALAAPARHGAPRLVVWPENAMNFFVEAEPRYRGAIERALAETGVPLLAGGPSGDADKLPPYFNSVFLIAPGAGVVARYDKEYLVPFSEYFPAASLDFMRRRLDGARTFAHGPARPAPLETPLGRAGILICNEGMLPEVAADRVRAGAELLVSPSNDGWIAGRAFAEHMLAVVALRAVEQGRYLVRASTSGPSAVVDPYGRILARTAPFARESLVAAVRPETRRTVYARLGDAFGAACIAASVAGCAVIRRREALSAI